MVKEVLGLGRKEVEVLLEPLRLLYAVANGDRDCERNWTVIGFGLD